MTKDTVLFGALSGIIGNIPKMIIGWIFHFLGLLRYTFEHIAAGYFVSLKYIDKPISLLIGFISDYILAGFFGVIMYIIIQQYGKDFAVLKGVLFGGVTYFLFYGAFMALDMTRASLLTPLPNLLLLFPHIIYGGFTGWIIKKFSLKQPT
ncbi:MAG: hypothetical protein K6U80_09320 [Firmicutes bacterium]|nr:hypothetical protein [Bacillota bacterium]